MNHIGLYYYTVAAEELNFTRAAAKLFIRAMLMKHPSCLFGMRTSGPQLLRVLA